MKKIFVLAVGVMLMLQQGNSQSLPPWVEDFDGSLPPTNWTVSPSGSWVSNTIYFRPGSSQVNPQSYLGFVPNWVGDSTILETGIYDCSPYQYVYLRFSHICKLAQTDQARIEYCLDMGGGVFGRWTVLPKSAYKGASTAYNTYFNAASYTDWDAANLAALPPLSQTWWKDEQFDLQQEVGWGVVKFRFVIKHGNTANTQLAYGWLLENFEVMASTFQIAPPTVQFISPLVRDTVYNVGPYEINAKVKTRSNAPIRIPYLKYTATRNGQVVATDSTAMTHVRGDSLWKISIPQFELGTRVSYSIMGMDTNGNSASDYSEYTILMPPRGGGNGNYVIQGDATTTEYYPFQHTYGYSRYMTIYRASEMTDEATGLIESLALRVGRSAAGTFPMKIWLKTVPISKTVWTTANDNLDWSVLTQNATLVYDGNFAFNQLGWVDVPFSQEFIYDRTSNLVVMFEQNCGGSNCSALIGTTTYPNYYNKSLTSTDSCSFHWYSDNNAPTPTSGTKALRTTRPDLRINVIGFRGDSNSVQMLSINIPDTVNLVPLLTVPITVTVKNKGIASLDSVTLSYSINNVWQKDTVVHFTPALPWGFSQQITLGNFRPLASQSNDVVVWVQLPNGQTDSITRDDTLRGKIYGRTDLVMSFTQTPPDTVSNTGPHEVMASIYVKSGASLTSVPALYIETILAGSSAYDTLPMQLTTNNIWRVSIPHQQYGSDVIYTLKGTDAIGNEIELQKRFHVKSPANGVNDFVIIGTGTSTSGLIPYINNYHYSFWRSYYLSKEVSPDGRGGLIHSIAFYNISTSASNVDNISFYLKATSSAVNTSSAYADPQSNGATLVWGSATSSTGGVVGWKTFTLNTPFYLPPDSNLLVYCNNQDGNYNNNGTATWQYTTQLTNTTVYGYADGTVFPPASNLTMNGQRPNLRMNITLPPPFMNSAALVSINSPVISALGGIPNTVNVTIKNKGQADLTSCEIHWTVNGIPKSVTHYNRRLYADFTDTITLDDTYIPTPGKRDTIVVWVSQPNNVADSANYDDTLRVTPMGCAYVMSGIMTVGNGQMFNTITDFWNNIHFCPVTGDITLEVTGRLQEKLDFTNLSNYMNGYSLTITSAGNNPNNATIEVTAGTDAAFILNNANNLTFKAITIDVSALTVPAFTITGSCSNVLIENCRLLGCPACTTSTSTSNALNSLIYKTSSKGTLNGLTVKNNTFSGGYYGIYLHETAYGYHRNIRIDSNTMNNQYYGGLYAYYVSQGSISANHITPRIANQGTIWYGIYTDYFRTVNITSNRVFAKNAGITSTLIGIRPYHADSASLVANNEVILFSEAATTEGIKMDYPQGVNVFHNTVYNQKNGATGNNNAYWAYNNNTSERLVVKNNIFVAEGGAAGATYAIYIGGTATNYANTVIGYNNYVSSGTNIGYASSGRPNLAQWQTAFPQDLHSIIDRPVFVDTAVSLNIINYRTYDCPLLPQVTTDITGTPRIGFGIMGCYQIPRFDNDATPVKVLGLENGVIPGQTNNYVNVVVQNAGMDTIKQLQLSWYIRGTLIGTVTPPSISLAADKFDTIFLGAIPPPYTYAGDTITVVINLVNNVIDQKPSNDTLIMGYISCTAPYSGVYAVGVSSPTFPDLTTALTRMQFCGISGKVTLQLEDGTYDESADLSKIVTTANDTLELVSLSGNAVIRATGFGIKTGIYDNIYIKDITVNLTGVGHGILLGGGSNVEIRGCKINLDTTLAKNQSNPEAHVGIYKSENSPIANNVRIINNVITGGYGTIDVTAGDTNQHGTGWRIDSNTIQKGYYYNAWIYYTDLSSISNNLFTPMSSTVNTTSGWLGLVVPYCNVQTISGNKIHGQNLSTNVTDPCGMYFHHLNNNTAPAEIYNNEIILTKTGNSSAENAITFYLSSGNIYHNSIYVKENANSDYVLLYLNTDKPVNVKNNNLIATNCRPIEMDNTNAAVLNYNNYYTKGAVLGSFNGTTAANLTAWKTLSSQDANSVSVMPKFANILQSMAVTDSAAYISCPVLPSVLTDINNTGRQYALTAMGAYEITPALLPTVRFELRPFISEAVVNQQVSIEITAANFSTVPVDEIVFNYTFNKGAVNTYTWRPATALQPLALPVSEIISTFNVTGDTSLKIWIASVDGQNNSLKDTFTSSLKMVSLVEFVPPLIHDTLFNVLSFDVNAKIHTATGAPLTPPVLYVECRRIDSVFTANIPMQLHNGIWTANLPQYYYNSQIFYSLTVSDMLGSSTIMDSVYLVAVSSMKDSIIIGTGTGGAYTLPMSMYYRTSWSRQIYLYREICPDLNPTGTTISKIAWYSQNINTTYARQTCYMRAVTDSVEVAGFVNPALATSGAKQVWTGTLTITPARWIEIELDTAFQLLPGQNLEIFWIHRDSAYPGSTYYWSYSPTTVNRAIYSQSDAGLPVTSTGTLSLNRANIKITKETRVNTYAGYNLSLNSMVAPVPDPNEICEKAHLPVRVSLMNLGEHDYDFAVNNIVVNYEITDPLNNVWTGSKTVNTGELLSGKAITLELKDTLAILSGQTTIKAWLNAPQLDGIRFDDTIRHTYNSAKISLPLNEYFKTAGMPATFTATPNNADGWQENHSGNFVQSDSVGTGILRFAAARGLVGKLTTSRQLDLYGTVNPRLDFWYYHDTALSQQDNSYMGVSVIVDGVYNNIFSNLLKRSKANHGWTKYSVNLSPYTNAQCVLVEFEAMNKVTGTEQYIDQILITSEQDLAVTGILLSPEIVQSCDLTNKSVYVVVSAATAQAVDLSQYSTSLAVNIPGYSTYYVPLNKHLAGRTSDTVFIASGINFTTGINTIRAYLTTPIDNNRLNDTAKRALLINPDVAIKAIANTNSASCFPKTFGAVSQQVTITNKGNFDVWDIPLVANVWGETNLLYTLHDTLKTVLEAGKSHTMTFSENYPLPLEEIYYVEVKAELACDVYPADNHSEIQECIDLDDINVIGVITPSSATEVMGSSINLEVRIENMSPSKTFQNVMAYAVISDGTNNIGLFEPIASISPQNIITCKFASPYIVPNGDYTITVFVGKTDNYQNNDTIIVNRTPKSGDGIKDVNLKGFALGQNIPNPANDNTRIEYTLPEDGQVIFTVYTVTGQSLHVEKREAYSGRNNIEFNTFNLANGIYYYSVEYKGERLVKKMTVRK